MYKVEDKKIIFENGELFTHLPSLGYGSHSDVYKFRIGKEIYALKVYNGSYEENLEKIKNLSNIKIDSYISNVMYDNGFKMIDMDEYPYEKKQNF